MFRERRNRNKYSTEGMDVVTNPPIPYWGVIPGGLQVGRMILISGQVPYGAQRFNIDFSKGINRSSAVIALHTNPRLSERVIVRNSFVNGSWQMEERHPESFPLSTGSDFEMMFLVEENCYKIAINGRHYADFKHRVPIHGIDKINIEGAVRIKKIQYSWQTPQVLPSYPSYPSQPTVFPPPDVCRPAYPVCPTGPFVPSSPASSLQPVYNPTPQVLPSYPSYPSQPTVHPPPEVCRPSYPVCPTGPFVPPSPVSSLQPVYNPALPFTYPFYGGLSSGMMIYVSGRPTACATRFEVNLQTSAAPYPPPDIALHINPRFDQNCVVRNSRINNSWGSEERQGYMFPFALAVNFDMIIRVESGKFMIAVNGRHFAEFRHRVMPLSRVNTLTIEGDAIISCIRFQ